MSNLITIYPDNKSVHMKSYCERPEETRLCKKTTYSIYVISIFLAGGY